MSIAGSDGRLADGSEHSLGLYHSGDFLSTTFQVEYDFLAVT